MVFQKAYVSRTSQVKPLKKVLDQWLKLNDRYYSQLTDLVSCYTELSSVSHFCSAAWSVPNEDWIGLQEYQAVKRENSRGRRKKNGRADLFLQNSKISYVAEAKRIYLNIRNLSPEKFITKVNDKVWLAWDDTKKTENPDEADVALAITFFDLQTPCENDEELEKISKKLGEYIKLIEKNKFDAGAYWFLETPIVEDKWAYCGTYLVLEKFTR